MPANRTNASPQQSLYKADGLLDKINIKAAATSVAVENLKEQSQRSR